MRKLPVAEQRADAVEIEQVFHQGGVVRHRVDNLDAGVAERHAFEGIEVDVLCAEDAVAGDLAGARENGLGDTLRCRAAVGGVELDAEVLVGAAGVVAGREDDAAVGPVFADHAGGGRRGEQTALADQYFRDAIGGRHAENDLDGLPVVIAAVTAQHERAARERRPGVEDRLDEVFQVVRRLEDPDLLAQAGGAGALVGKGLGVNGCDVHGAVRPACLGMCLFNHTRAENGGGKFRAIPADRIGGNLMKLNVPNPRPRVGWGAFDQAGYAGVAMTTNRGVPGC